MGSETVLCRTEETGARPSAAPQRIPWLYTAVRLLAYGLMTPSYAMAVEGREHLPQDRAFILLPKHQRWQDVLLLGLAAPRPLLYVAKVELFSHSWTRWLFEGIGAIPLNRKRPMESRRYLRAVMSALSNGEGVVVFPEGTYFRRHMGPGRLGMVRFVSSRQRLPFIPVGIAYGRDGWRNRVTIRFGEPRQLPRDASIETFLGQLMGDIARLCGLGPADPPVVRG